MALRLNVLFLALVVVGFTTKTALAAEPAWLAGKPMNQWFEINGTSGAAGAVLNAWGSLILREDTTELFVAASGGHGDSSDNRVVSIKLTDDQPQWIIRAEPTPVEQRVVDVAYYLDGLPSSRHNYQHNFWVPAINRIIMCGARFTYGSAYTFLTVDGFNPETNKWDPQNTWPNVTISYGVVRERNSSIIWTNALERVDLEQRTITLPITSTANVEMRWPVAHDSLRHQLFSLQWGDSQGYGTGIQASRIPLNPGNTQLQVTFKSSQAVDMFSAEMPTYAAMDYDPINDRFLFYNGQGTSAGRIYVITPNDGNEWDMSILPLDAGSATPDVVPASGINRRFLYVPGLNVFVMMPLQEGNIWFIRVGNFEQIPQSAPYVASPEVSTPQSSNTPTSSSGPKAQTSIAHQLACCAPLLVPLVSFVF